MADLYNTVTRELTALGFEYWKRAKGSHEKWKSLRTGKVLLVPYNLKSRHTANAILRAAESTRKV